MTNDSKPLSPRHERFVAEYLKDLNATQAYVRAGYAPRGAQPSASRLLRDPRIAAAIAAGQQRIARRLEVSAERITQEYAKIAFASVDDYTSKDADGRQRVDLDKADHAQRAGILELWVSNHNKREQSVRLKLGKLQGLAALAKQLGMGAADVEPEFTRNLAEDIAAGRKRVWGDDKSTGLVGELAEAREALAAAQAKLAAAGLDDPSREAPPPPDDRPHPDDGKVHSAGSSASAPREPVAPDKQSHPPERVPVWPQPNAKPPVRGSSEHAHWYRLLRRGELDSHLALQMHFHGLNEWPRSMPKPFVGR